MKYRLDKNEIKLLHLIAKETNLLYLIDKFKDKFSEDTIKEFDLLLSKVHKDYESCLKLEESRKCPRCGANYSIENFSKVELVGWIYCKEDGTRLQEAMCCECNKRYVVKRFTDLEKYVEKTFKD